MPVARSRRIRTFESSVEKLGRILSQRWKIRVVFKHDTCETSGKVIYLPTLPNNANQQLLDAMQGHLDHEVAHVVFTDFDALKKVKRRDKKLFITVNALEDPRVEYKYINLWPGARVNLSRSLEWSLEKIAEEREVEDENGVVQKKRGWDSLSVFGKLTSAASLYAQVRFKQDHWFIDEVVDDDIRAEILRTEQLIHDAAYASDTAQVIKIAKQLMAAWQQEEEPVNYVDPADVEDDAIILPPQPKGADTSAMYEQPKDPPKSDGPPVYQAELQDEDDEETEPQDGSEPSQAPGISASAPAGESEEDDSDSGDVQCPQSASDHSSGDEEDVSSGGARRPDFSDVTPQDLKNDLEIMNRGEQLREAASQEFTGHDNYLIYTTEGDIYETIKEGDRSAFRDFWNESVAMVSAIKRKMARNMLATNVTRWEGGKPRGKIDTRAVFRVPLGTSKNVFRKRVETQDYNTVVQMMVDHSGSMSGLKLDLAAKTSIILGAVLDQLGIPFSICGFSTGDWDAASRRSGRVKVNERNMYTRWGDLWIGVYKDFDEPWNRVNHRLINMVRNEQANTYDGESLRWGANRLIHRPEPRKIMFWLNDGQPQPNGADNGSAHREYARKSAKEVEDMVEVMAFGIKTDAVKNYYTNYVVVNKLTDLPAVCLGELDALLRKGKRLHT